MAKNCWASAKGISYAGIRWNTCRSQPRKLRWFPQWFSISLEFNPQKWPAGFELFGSHGFVLSIFPSRCLNGECAGVWPSALFIGKVFFQCQKETALRVGKISGYAWRCPDAKSQVQKAVSQIRQKSGSTCKITLLRVIPTMTFQDVYLDINSVYIRTIDLTYYILTFYVAYTLASYLTYVLAFYLGLVIGGRDYIYIYIYIYMLTLYITWLNYKQVRWPRGFMAIRKVRLRNCHVLFLREPRSRSELSWTSGNRRGILLEVRHWRFYSQW